MTDEETKRLIIEKDIETRDYNMLRQILDNLNTTFNYLKWRESSSLKIDDICVKNIYKVGMDFEMYIRHVIIDLENYTDKDIVNYNSNKMQKTRPIFHHDILRLLRQYVVLRQLTTEG